MFAVKNIQVLNYAMGFTSWIYKSDTDDIATISTQGYFDSAIDMLARNDLIAIGAPDGVALRYVASALGTVAIVPLER